MRIRLIDNAWQEFNRLWSIRFSILFAVFTGVVGVIGGFIGTVNPWVLVGASVFFNVALLPLARLTKQAVPE